MKRLLLCLLLCAAPLRAGIVLEASTDALELVTATAATVAGSYTILERP